MNSTAFRIAVLISGAGTTLRNLVARREQGKFPIGIGLVISSNREAAGIEIARDAGIPVEIFDYRVYRTPASLSDPVFDACRSHAANLVVLGGFLRKLIIPAEFEHRVINIHPSLIPEFCGKGMYGRRVHQAVIDSGAAKSGCTVHEVDNDYDHGPILAQREVPVLPGDTADALAARVFAAECDLYPEVILRLARRHGASIP